uniref:Endonuclease/exonuclease/phosphatase domain-containing protein n=1 Tax=Timema shepardi TaxID=629360 RepID=A0A7R9ANL7_TIMSH|nr:unnamed protein product [Timema shepardi]
METVELPSENARQGTSNSQKSKPRIPPIVVAGTTDREHGKGGGTAVIIKDYLPHYRANINDTENLEATTISISTKTGHINFVAAYNPPSKILLKQDLDNITSSDNYFIGGDLNSKNTLIDHPELSYLLSLKREARRDWQRLRTPNERTRYNRLKAIVKRTVNQIRRTNFNTFVTDTATNMQKTCTITKVLKGTSKKSNTPAIHGKQGMAFSSLDKANAIALTLEDQFKPNPVHDQNFNRDVTRSVNDYIQRPITDLPAPITEQELQTTIKQLKLNKAPWKTDKFNSTMGSWGCILLSMVWKYMFWISSTVLPLTATSIFSSKALQKTYRHHIRCLGDLPRVIYEGVRVEGLATDSAALHRTQIYVSAAEERINYPPQSIIDIGQPV